MNILNPGPTLRQISQLAMIRLSISHFRRLQFLTPTGAFAYYGLFASFKDARAWLPPTKEFDSPSLATEYVDVRAKQVFEYDYPVMWRLERALLSGAKNVLDIGGSVGVHYYAYKPYIAIMDCVNWEVVEVPAIAAIGRSLAIQNGAKTLSFAEDLDQALKSKAYNIWVSAGAIQYIEDARPDHLLERSGARPQHILLNKLPLYDGDDFVTTQNLGNGLYAPLHVYNRRQFIDSIESLGYTLRDHWPVHERSLQLPGYPERSFPTFSGLYFEATRSSAKFVRLPIVQHTLSAFARDQMIWSRGITQRGGIALSAQPLRAMPNGNHPEMRAYDRLKKIRPSY